MANIRYNQNVFTYGELAPQLYARVDFDGYYKGVKQGKNVLPIPQGGLIKRFGTTYVDTLTVTDQTQCDLVILNYEDNILYVTIWQPTTVTIYLENIKIATVTGTSYNAPDIASLRFSQAGNQLVITNPNFQPAVLQRSDGTPNVIAGVVTASNEITVTTAVTANIITPVYFTTLGSLPTTSPQIYSNRTYFARTIDTTHIRIFSTPEDAANNVNYYTVSAAGSSSHVVFQNSWAVNTITFDYVPAYDFIGNAAYAALTFTPGATSGSTTLTASSAFFTSEMVGGLFQGNTGTMRLTTYTNTTTMSGLITENFPNTNAIPGSLSFIGEPAWSTTRGWPSISSYYQQRAVFANTPSLPQGVWLSTIGVGEGSNFDDSDIAPDNAISYYAQSGAGCFLKSIVSAETLLLQSNLAAYSSPAGATTPATPNSFFLVEQNKDGIGNVPAVHIDNQVIYVDSSGTTVKNMQFDIIQGKYVLNNISVSSSHLINNPVDMSAYSDPEFTDGAFVLTVNSDGTLAVYHTLIEQEISGWTQCFTNTAAGQSKFIHVANGVGSAWFLVQRVINNATIIYLEQLDFTQLVDCAVSRTNVNSSTVSNLSWLIGETVQVVADTYYLGEFYVGPGAQINLTYMGQPYTATNVQLGLSIPWTIEPLPIALNLQEGSNFYKPWHVRSFYVSYYETLGMYINGVLVPEQNMNNFVLGATIMPQSGVYESTPMGEWDPFDPYADQILITGTEPYPMTLIGIGYSLEA